MPTLAQKERRIPASLTGKRRKGKSMSIRLRGERKGAAARSAWRLWTKRGLKKKKIRHTCQAEIALPCFEKGGGCFPRKRALDPFQGSEPSPSHRETKGRAERGEFKRLFLPKKEKKERLLAMPETGHVRFLC